VTTPVTRTRLPDSTLPALTFVRSASIWLLSGAIPGAAFEQPAALTQSNATTRTRWRFLAGTRHAGDRPVHKPVIESGFTGVPRFNSKQKASRCEPVVGKAAQSFTSLPEAAAVCGRYVRIRTQNGVAEVGRSRASEPSSRGGCGDRAGGIDGCGSPQDHPQHPTTETTNRITTHNRMRESAVAPFWNRASPGFRTARARRRLARGRIAPARW